MHWWGSDNVCVTLSRCFFGLNENPFLAAVYDPLDKKTGQSPANKCLKLFWVIKTGQRKSYGDT